MADRIPLAALPSTLREVCGASPTYDVVYRAGVNGRIPIQRSHTNRLTVALADLPKIAKALGLPAPAKARRSA